MATRIAFVRALNLGPAHRLPMQKLRAMAKSLSLADVKTIGSKGNLVFSSEKSATALEQLLDRGAKKHLHVDTEVFVRTPSQLRAVIAKNPFPEEAKRDPAHLLVYVMKRKAPAKAVTALRAAIQAHGGAELVRAGPKHLYLFYPKGIGRSKLTSALMDSVLHIRGTARNWNTMQSLAEAR